MSTDWIQQYDRALAEAAAQMATWDSIALSEYVQRDRIESWTDFERFVREHRTPNVFFRGQGDARWSLRPSLERLTSFPIGTPDEAVKKGAAAELIQDAFYAEFELSREFKRRAHHYLTHLPDEGEQIEWLALMQHHGVPTRLLDWTLSPYVAAYFAVYEADPRQDATVWAVDAGLLQQTAARVLGLPAAPKSAVGRHREYFYLHRSEFERHFIDNPKVAVLPLQPYHMNERLTVQQGVFLCPANIVLSFENNLRALVAQADGSICLYRADIPGSVRHEFLYELNRMNINHATLFPGLDGFAAALRYAFKSAYEQSVEGLARDRRGDDASVPKR